jgi:plastocyanin
VSVARLKAARLVPGRGALVLALLVAVLSVAAACSSSAPSQAPVDPNAIKIVASGLQFTTKAVSAPANKPFKIAFESQTADPHNLAIAVSGAPPVFRSEVFTGPATRVFDIEALAAGPYIFRCDVHPGMEGTLTVQ